MARDDLSDLLQGHKTKTNETDQHSMSAYSGCHDQYVPSQLKPYEHKAKNKQNGLFNKTPLNRSVKKVIT